jgi:hypothetical protein
MKDCSLIYTMFYFAVVLVAVTTSETDDSTPEDNNNTTSTATEEDLIECPLCSDPSRSPQDPFSIFVAGEATMSCQTAYDLGPLRLPELNCTFWQQRGDTICQCGTQDTSTPNTCTLCESGEALPSPFLEVRPNTICGQLQIEARRDVLENCVIWQQTYGVYCGCNNSIVTGDGYDVCRLCEDDEVFDPMAMVDYQRAEEREATEESLSCGEVEFLANLSNNSCSELTSMFGASCCRDAPVSIPSQAPSVETKDSASSTVKMSLVSLLTPVVASIAYIT